jgi:Spy/CpxP family protein refolding chaperone
MVMKTRFLSLLVVIILTGAPLQVIVADDDTMTGQAAPATGSDTTGAGQGQGERAGKWRKAFEQLGLTDAQKTQIKQIRASVPAGKERRQQIMAVLTPDQKVKLMQMVKAHQGGNQPAGDTTTSTDPVAPASTTTTLPPP